MKATIHESMPATDPRWVFAVRVRESLEGAALPPQRRQALDRLADRLGLRPFDANLIIAIVQDHARRGLVLNDAAMRSLQMIAPPRPARRSDPLAVAALLLLALLVEAWAVIAWWR